MLFATLQTSLALICVCWIYKTVTAKLTVRQIDSVLSKRVPL